MAARNVDSYDTDFMAQLDLMRNRINEEFANLQNCIKNRQLNLLRELGELEREYNEVKTTIKNLQDSKKELTKLVKNNTLKEKYKDMIKQVEEDISHLTLDVSYKFSRPSLQFDSHYVKEAIKNYGKLKCGSSKIESELSFGSNSFDSDRIFKNRNIPFKKFSVLGLYIKSDHLGLTIDSHDNIYITDSAANKIIACTADGVYVNSLLAEQPVAICVRNNILYISEWKSHTICKMNTDGSSVKRIGASRTELGQFNYPFGLTTNTDYLYVCDSKNHRLLVLTHELQPIRKIQSKYMNNPTDINIYNNALYVLNNSISILVISVEGQFLTHIASIQNYVFGASYFCIDSASNIIISDCKGSCIRIFSISGLYQETLGETINNTTNQPYCSNSSGIAVLSNNIIVNSCGKRTQDSIQLF